MRIEINMPDTLWATVLEVAESNDTTVPRVVEAAIRDALRSSAMRNLQHAARRRRIVTAWGRGMTDVEIAEHTGELRNYVADVRRKAKLPPNHSGTTTQGRK